jgi:hypothetical protein
MLRMRQNQGTPRAGAIATAFVLFSGCASVETRGAASAPAGPATQAAPDAPEVELRLDYSGLFDVVSSTSMIDASVVRPGLMERLLVEPSLFSKEDGAEAWFMDLMLGWLGEHDTHIIAPPLPGDLEVRTPCPTGGCAQPLPTAVLRYVNFVSGTDQIAVTAQQEESGIILSIRRDPDDKSLCPPDYKLPLGYVQLRAVVERLSDGALAALIRETRLLTTPAHPVVTAALPEPATAPVEFCAGVLSVLETAREFRRSDARYLEAGRLLLDAALGPLYPAPASKPAAK